MVDPNDPFRVVGSYLQLKQIGGEPAQGDDLPHPARMAELVDALGLGSSGATREGSSPFTCIKKLFGITMKRFLFGLLGFAAVNTGVLGLTASSTWADDSKITKGYNTMDSMGCMLVRDCTDGVKEVNNISDIADEYPDTVSYDRVADEFNRMLVSLNKVGVKVFLADQKYFPPMHRGVYHTVGNNFFLNRKYMRYQGTLMQVMRHEGWHAAQDCMAGTIENSLIAIIKPEDEVPMIWRALAERTYPENAVPWEAEAGWAGRTEGMTEKALAACATGKMWEVYEPTPLTRKYLVEEGFMP